MNINEQEKENRIFKSRTINVNRQHLLYINRT